MILSAISAIQPLPPLDDTTEHTEGEELGVNSCRSSASALCQTGNNNGKSWNSPVVSLVTGLVARKSSRSKSCRPKPELNALLSLKKLSNTLHLGRKQFECQSCKSNFVFLHYFVMWLAQKTCITFSTNQIQNKNQLWPNSLFALKGSFLFFTLSSHWLLVIFPPYDWLFYVVWVCFTSPNWKPFYLLVSLLCFTLLCFTLPFFFVHFLLHSPHS